MAENGLAHTTDYPQLKKHFLQELTKASHGEESSLSWIQHHLPEKPLVQQGIVQGIVIGGTNYILSTEHLDGKKRTIIERKIGIIPTFTTREVLQEFFSQHLDKRADAIGINFGFPLSPTSGKHGELDSRLLYATKEHRFLGVSQPIGSIVNELFLKLYHKDIPVSVANDTVCLMLSGDGTEHGSLIAGTGLNIGLARREENERMIINLEAGNFNKFSISPILKAIDENSERPGKQLFEKVISGKYLSLYFNAKAREEGIIAPHIQTSQELSALSYHPQSDHERAIARMLLEQSACMVASALAAVYAFCHEPKDFTIIGEGSILWKGWKYQEHMQKQLKALGLPDHAITIKHINDSSINGAIGLLTQ